MEQAPSCLGKTSIPPKYENKDYNLKWQVRKEMWKTLKVTNILDIENVQYKHRDNAMWKKYKLSTARWKCKQK